MTDTAVLVRTHYVDDELRRLISSLAHSSPHPVYALVDESVRPVEFGATPKISLTAELAGELGLYDGAERLYWRCGDYGLYAARRALPQVERFWMIEPDVRLRLERPGGFFDRFADTPADLLVSNLRPAEPSWDWAKTMDDGAPVWRCLFPLVRVGARALDALLDARRAFAARFVAAGADSQFWPNDEVFTATTLMRAGFDCRDLNADGEVYDPASFGYWWPLSDRQVAESGREGFAYHPVLNGDRYFQKLFHLAVRLNDFDALEGAIAALTGVEWDETKAGHYRRAAALARSCARPCAT
jgi:hypothetical protein